MKSILSFSLIIITVLTNSQLKSQDVYNLWEGQKIPYYKENSLEEYEKEAWGTRCVYDITNPTLTIYKAEGENTGKAVIIIPGGGYSLVALYHEGYNLAKLLAKSGITAAVLKYRLPNPKSSDQPHLVPLTDTRRAFSLIRKNAGKYGFDKNIVGVMGFSAGSHLATVASLWKSDIPEENPNFSALIYGVTRLNDENLKWLEESLYYRKLTENELTENRLLDLVNTETPPAFLVHAYDDDVCNVLESTLYAQKLYEKKVLAEMHLFPKGGHGFGMGRKEDGTNKWVELFINWVKNHKF